LVIWLLGLSGSGKTTLGKRLQDYYKKKEKDVYLIDGDLVRSFFENDLGYTKEDRMENIKRIVFGAYLLEQKNVITIVCNISPFEELRQFARRKLNHYIEVFLDREISQCIDNDVKTIYKQNLGKTEIIGIDIEFDIPKQPDIVIDTGNQSEEESLAIIINYLKGRITR